VNGFGVVFFLLVVGLLAEQHVVSRVVLRPIFVLVTNTFVCVPHSNILRDVVHVCEVNFLPINPLKVTLLYGLQTRLLALLLATAGLIFDDLIQLAVNNLRDETELLREALTLNDSRVNIALLTQLAAKLQGHTVRPAINLITNELNVLLATIDRLKIRLQLNQVSEQIVEFLLSSLSKVENIVSGMFVFVPFSFIDVDAILIFQVLFLVQFFGIIVVDLQLLQLFLLNFVLDFQFFMLLFVHRNCVKKVCVGLVTGQEFSDHFAHVGIAG